MKSEPKNIAASIRQRLLNHAKMYNRPFNEILQYFAMERFLYRLSKSPHARCFILKGALVLRIWDAPVSRPTMDIDLLGRTSNEEDHIIRQIKEILLVNGRDDGLLFDGNSVIAESISEDADYRGVRIRFNGTLDTARVYMQIDIGFSDIVYPHPEESILPTILELPAPVLLTYSRESVIAEKFEAMIKLGTVNSRMKDFYDIWMLSRQFSFNGESLAEAIRLTFCQRGTALPMHMNMFEQSFIEAKQIQWIAFCRRLQQDHVPMEFDTIISSISQFLLPLTSALNDDRPLPARWHTTDGWLFGD